MNNKGFTLMEVLCALMLISLMAVVIFRQVNTTLSVSNNEAYKLMKNSILSASEIYIRESEAGLIKSDFSFKNNSSFSASVLKKYGYFTDLRSPIDGKDVGDCLIITVTKGSSNKMKTKDKIKEKVKEEIKEKIYNDDSGIIIDLKDNCYK